MKATDFLMVQFLFPSPRTSSKKKHWIGDDFMGSNYCKISIHRICISFYDRRNTANFQEKDNNKKISRDKGKEKKKKAIWERSTIFSYFSNLQIPSNTDDICILFLHLHKCSIANFVCRFSFRFGLPARIQQKMTKPRQVEENSVVDIYVPARQKPDFRCWFTAHQITKES